MQRVHLVRLTALWQKETLALLRDRHGLIALFLMPAIFIVVMTMALHDAFMPGAAIDVAYAVVDLDDSPASRALVARLDKAGSFRRIATERDAELARQQVRAGRQALALVVPAGFGERLLAPGGIDGKPTAPLQLLVDPVLNPALQLAFRTQVSAVLGTLRADELSQRAGQLFGLPTAGQPVERAWPDDIVSVAVQNERNVRPPSSVQQNVPAWLVFAMFFVVIPIASIFIVERQQGTLQRLRALGLPFGLVLLGKLLPFFVVNQLQAVLMVLIGRYVVPLFGGEALHIPDGGALALAWLLCAAVSLAAIGWALLVATLTRTPQQATVVGGVGNILMGAIGGVMVPKFMMPAAMQQLAALSPMAWALDGLHTVVLRHGGLAEIAGQLGLLFAFAGGTLLLAVLVSRKSA
ncbi:MAG: ABC transporter permease [Azonexaceae bacterium]|nr:ABC transporter permease [Azonexaceae bacterium]